MKNSRSKNNNNNDNNNLKKGADKKRVKLVEDKKLMWQKFAAKFQSLYVEKAGMWMINNSVWK